MLRRYSGTLESEEAAEKDRFLEECIADPSLRDKMSILTRTFKNKQKVYCW
jgi:hydrocephalus-inducing protein